MLFRVPIKILIQHIAAYHSTNLIIASIKSVKCIIIKTTAILEYQMAKYPLTKHIVKIIMFTMQKKRLHYTELPFIYIVLL